MFRRNIIKINWISDSTDARTVLLRQMDVYADLKAQLCRIQYRSLKLELSISYGNKNTSPIPDTDIYW